MNIQITGLSKSYDNGTRALQNLNLSIKDGIFGLLGPNGSGKTTFIRILSTVMRFEEGEVIIDGLNLRYNINEIRKMTGYLPQEFSLYPNLTLTEFLDYMCLLNEIKTRSERKKRVDQALEQTNLTQSAHKRLKTLSGGMKRRAGLAQSLLNNPRFLLLDEPTAGLDPEEKIKFRNLLSSLGRDRLVIFSTHIISDLENVCYEIGILNRGRLLFKGALTELQRLSRAQVWTGSCGADELSVSEDEFLVVNKKLVDGRWAYRIIGDRAPFIDSTIDAMNMEDAYLSIVRRAIL